MPCAWCAQLFCQLKDFEIEQATKEAINEASPAAFFKNRGGVKRRGNKLDRKEPQRWDQVFCGNAAYSRCVRLQNREKALIDLVLFPLQLKNDWLGLYCSILISRMKWSSLFTPMEVFRKEIMDIRVGVQWRWKTAATISGLSTSVSETGSKSPEIEAIIEGSVCRSQSENLIELNAPCRSIRWKTWHRTEKSCHYWVSNGGPFVGEIFEELKTRVLANRPWRYPICTRTIAKKRMIIWMRHSKDYTVEKKI